MSSEAKLEANKVLEPPAEPVNDTPSVRMADDAIEVGRRARDDLLNVNICLTTYSTLYVY